MENLEKERFGMWPQAGTVLRVLAILGAVAGATAVSAVQAQQSAPAPQADQRPAPNPERGPDAETSTSPPTPAPGASPTPAAQPAPAEPAPAPDAAASAPAKAEDRGPVTNLPLPRYVSLKASEGNVRRGPSLTHRIDWGFKRRDMPLEVTAEFGHWRRVHDRDGAGGWVHYSLISGVRTVVVEAEMLDLRAQPEAGAPVVARAQAGVIARLGECAGGWCRITADGYTGWAPTSAMWGVKPDEERE